MNIDPPRHDDYKEHSLLKNTLELVESVVAMSQI
jgi:hypothetical protein